MIIGLVGFIGSGKGTVGDYLHLYGYHRGSFAGVLKDTASVLFGWERELLEGDTKESREFREKKDEWWSERFGYDFSPRLALQLLGTEAGRDVFHKDVWIYTLERRIHKWKEESEDDNVNVVVTDTRFPNEMNWIRSQGGIIVEVRRGSRPEWYEDAILCNYNDDPDLPARGRMASKGIHFSEWAWIGQKIDYTIYNDGSLDDLVNNVKDLLTKIENDVTINNV